MIAWFARHQTAANLLMAAIMILGLVSLPGLQRETLPEVQNEEVQVRVVYKGATPDEVEDAICRRLEDALEGITNLDELRCDAREGVGTGTVVMLEGADMMRFLDDIKSEVDAIEDFPEQTEAPVIEELGRTEPVISPVVAHTVACPWVVPALKATTAFPSTVSMTGGTRAPRSVVKVRVRVSVSGFSVAS